MIFMLLAEGNKSESFRFLVFCVGKYFPKHFLADS